MSTTCTDDRPDRSIPQHHDYVAAARRDPRDHPFGYLARDPVSGARGAFLWFRSAGDLQTWISGAGSRAIRDRSRRRRNPTSSSS